MKKLQKNRLAILGGKPVINRKKPHFVWPIITKQVERAVVKQLHESVSIYNRSGIFKEFEEFFASYHNRKYCLVGNSGTTSLYTMYVAAGVGPGDEVICPAYTFFATASPIFFTGAKPVLADCDINGNIDPQHVESLITRRTKAIVVTHMWGVPAQMDKLSQICKKYKLLLMEDCSHAHGAKYKNKLVGTYGDIAVWSLQGQKTVTGGEGGVLLTDSPEIYYRSLLLGHYNKRCLQEIPSTHPLYKYGVTGMGLKLRAHPLAIAMANEQLTHLNDWLKKRNVFAKKLIKAASDYPGLTPPFIESDTTPSWYALVWQYKPEHFDGLVLKDFYEALQAEGLVEFDLPRSTAPLNLLPLFQNPENFFPGYRGQMKYRVGQFPVAEKFYNQAIKLPVWHREIDSKMVDLYSIGLKKVLDNYYELLKFKK
jgi:dTDP-4-amino-4,6-dideoxygalactose transaminase